MRTTMQTKRIGRFWGEKLRLSALVVGLWGAFLFAGCKPSGNSSTISSRPETVSSSLAVSTEASEARNSTDRADSIVQEVAVRIDTMMCVEGCFNSVKELLEKRPGIEGVRLAPQKEEGTIDNSMVFVKYRGELDQAELERLILGAGFDKMEIVP